MKHILTIILMLSCLVSYAQQTQRLRRGPMPNVEKYFQDRTDFVIQKMKLSPEDSVKFVPIYKEKLKAKGDLMMKSRPPHLRPGVEYADSMYLKAVNAEMNYQLEDAKLDLEYNKKFEKILTPKQLFIYLQAERQFVGSFMHRGNQRRGQDNSQEKK
ncbi:MAG: hypothetical protein HUJ97_04940 [Bacteroidales bacterium]|nr:hypothetical protein [Bacteroidales bacterium]